MWGILRPMTSVVRVVLSRHLRKLVKLDAKQILLFLCLEKQMRLFPMSQDLLLVQVKKIYFVSRQLYNWVIIISWFWGLARPRDVVGALVQSIFSDYTHCSRISWSLAYKHQIILKLLVLLIQYNKTLQHKWGNRRSNGEGGEQKSCELQSDQMGSLFHELTCILHWQRQRNIGPTLR